MRVQDLERPVHHGREGMVVGVAGIQETKCGYVDYITTSNLDLGYSN